MTWKHFYEKFCTERHLQHFWFGVISFSALVFSLSFALHVMVEVKSLDLKVSQTVIDCANSDFDAAGYAVCKRHVLKYGVFNED